MFRRFIAVFMLILLGCDAGSLTTPDEDDMVPLVSAVRNMPPGVRKYVEHSKDLDAVEKLKEQNPDRPVADIRCGPSDQIHSQMTMRQLYFFMKDFLDAISGGTPSYDRTIAQMSFWQYLSSKLAEQGCRADFLPYTDFNYIEEREEPPTKANRSYQDDLGIAHWLIALTAIEISRMPSLMTALGIGTGVGGTMVALEGFGLLLCPLSESIACPDDPGAPGVPQQPPHGDR